MTLARPSTLVAFVMICALAAGSAWGGSVRRTDGTTLSGDVSIRDGRLAVAPAGGAVVAVPPGDVADARFDARRPDDKHGLCGEYFADTAMTQRRLVRLDRVVDFAWDHDTMPVQSPADDDRIAARWTGFLDPPATGKYTLRTSTDDGVRLWVDGKQRVDAWADGIHEQTVEVEFKAGVKVPVRMEVFNATGPMAARLMWSGPGVPEQIIPAARLSPPADFHPKSGRTPEPQSPAAAAEHGLYAEYFADAALSRPCIHRIDPTIDFEWGDGSPDPAVPADFAGRWTGHLTPRYTETYTFTAYTDDGVRLWVDGRRVIDVWRMQVGENSGQVALTAGKTVDLRMEFFDGGSGAAAKLYWSSARQPKQIVPAECLTPATPEDRRNASRGHGLLGEYFADEKMTGPPVMVTRESAAGRAWDGNFAGSPLPERFGARWTGRLTPRASGTFTLREEVDDVGTVYLDGHPLLRPGATEATVGLSAGHAYDLKIEFANTGGGPAKMELYWSGPGIKDREVVPAECLSLPPDAPGAPPEVTLDPPAAEPVAPDGVPLAVKTWADQNDRITRVEYLADDRPIASSESPPFHVTWRHPPTGEHRLIARATDAAGLVVVSQAETITVVGNAGGALPKEWGELRIAPGDAAASPEPDGVARDGAGGFAVRASGDLWGRADSFHYVYRTLDGDGRIVARFAALAATDANGLPCAGLMIRARLAADSPHATALFTPGAAGFLRRRSAGGDAAFDGADGMAPPGWLRLERAGRRVTAATSTDGARWRPLGSVQLDLPDRAYVGVAVAARSGTCTATFADLAVNEGAEPMASVATGVVTVDGSQLAGELREITPDAVRVVARGKELTIKADDVARVLLKPMSADVAASLPAGRTGVVLTSGDVADGEFKGVRDGRAQVDSVLFGPQSFDVSRDVTAILLHDVAPPSGYEVTATDGSVFRTPQLSIDGDALVVTDARLGEVRLKTNDIARIHRAGAQ